MTISELIMWGAFALAQIADILTTNAALKRGGVEANPIIRTMMRVLGRAWWVGKLGIVALAAYVAIYIGSIVAIWAITAITAVIAYSNTRVAR